MRIVRGPLALALVVVGAGCASEAPAPTLAREEDDVHRETERGAPDESTRAPGQHLAHPNAPAAQEPADPGAEPGAELDGRYARGGWQEEPHGPGHTAGPAFGCRFDAPARDEACAPSISLPARPKLGVVVVRKDGVIVHLPARLLELEARLDGSVGAVVALAPGSRERVTLRDLADLGRAGGLDLVLVDARLAGSRSRCAWLVATATRELVGAFVDEPGETSIAPVSAGVELAARIEQAWLASP